jgi:hypothetical protein
MVRTLLNLEASSSLEIQHNYCPAGSKLRKTTTHGHSEQRKKVRVEHHQENVPKAENLHRIGPAETTTRDAGQNERGFALLDLDSQDRASPAVEDAGRSGQKIHRVVEVLPGVMASAWENSRGATKRVGLPST